MEKIQIHDVNVTPLVIIDLGKKDCLKFNEVEKLQNVEFKHLGNPDPMSFNNAVDISTSYNLLKDYKLNRIKKVFDYYMSNYTKEILGIEQKFKMVGSWLTRQIAGGTHHKHSHPNSMISALWYFNHDLQQSNMAALNVMLNGVNSSLKCDNLEFKVEKNTKYNYNTYHLYPDNNVIFIMPSHLMHYTDISGSNIPRYCIGTNYFVTGILGDTNQYSLLNVKT